MRVLLVKMSSLGDVVHTLPGLTDAVRALGDGVEFDWVVEDAFAAIPARHGAVAEVLPIAWRRWRRDLFGSAGAMRAFLGTLRRRRYDLVLDAQGLVKSAVVTALARGRCKAGLSWRSAREGAAAVCYDRRLEVPRGLHAVTRIRRLFAAALGYDEPDSPPDFGIAAARPAGSAEPATGGPPRCVLLHGTTWASKHWPERFWRALAGQAGAAGYQVVLPWGNGEERRRAERIAAGGNGRVCRPMTLDALIGEIGGAGLVVGVDSGLAHLSGALAVPTVVIYGSTSSELTGCRGARVRNLDAEFPCSPCLSRVCTYAGAPQHWQGERVVPACYATVPPERVWAAAEELMDADRVLHL